MTPAKPFLVLAVIAVVSGCLAHTGAPVPPCPEDWAPSPDGTRCVDVAQVCNGWFSGSADETVSCDVTSPDGDGHVRVSLQGLGEARVRVLDGVAQVVFDERYRASVVSDHPLAGAPGSWTLQVTFIDALGSGQVVVWG